MLINGIQVADRHNRPNANSKLALRALFYNDGVSVDPYEIAGVAIFKRSSNQYPNSILNASGLIADTSVPILNTTVLYPFTTITLHTNPSVSSNALNGFEESKFVLATGGAVGIYKKGVGDYVATLVPGYTGYYAQLPSSLNYYNYLATESLSSLNTVINTLQYIQSYPPASAVLNSPGEYIDVWTVKMNADSKYQTFINEFTIFSDTFTMVTEPPMVTVNSRLINKHINLGEKVDIKISNEISIQNKELSEAFKNTFKQSSITAPKIEIRKMNEVPTIGGSFEVSSYANTSALTYVTSDDTIIFTWDTWPLSAIQSANNAAFDNVRGTYAIRAKFDVLNQTKITSPFYVSVS